MAFNAGRKPMTEREMLEMILARQEQTDTDIKRLWGAFGNAPVGGDRTWQAGNLESSPSPSSSSGSSSSSSCNATPQNVTCGGITRQYCAAGFGTGCTADAQPLWTGYDDGAGNLFWNPTPATNCSPGCTRYLSENRCPAFAGDTQNGICGCQC